jgi:thiamine monophosphate kinase
VAVAGAAEIRLLSSITLPASSKAAGFRRLLDGIDNPADAHGARYVGGNLRDG